MNFFCLLPDELLNLIFSFLGPLSLCRSAQVCRKWLAESEASNLWFQLCKSRWLNSDHQVTSLLSSFSFAPEGAQRRQFLLMLEERRKRKRTSDLERSREREKRRASTSKEVEKHVSDGINIERIGGEITWKEVFAGKYNWLSGRYVVKYLRAHLGKINCIHLLSKSKIILTGSDDCTIRVWKMHATGSDCLVLRGHTKPVKCLHVMYNSQHQVRSTEIMIMASEYFGDINALWGFLLASGGADCSILLWNISHNLHLRTLNGHTSSVEQVQLMEDKLVSVSQDSELRVWNAWSGVCLQVISASGGHRVLSLKVRGRRRATKRSASAMASPHSEGSLSAVAQLDVQVGHCIKSVMGTVSAVVQELVCSLSANAGELQVTQSTQSSSISLDIEESELEQGTDLSSQIRHSAHDLPSFKSSDKSLVGEMASKGEVLCMAYDDKRMVLGCKNNTLRLFQFDNTISTHDGEDDGFSHCQHQPMLFGHTAAATCVQFDQEKIISGSLDKTIRVWSSASGKCLYTLSSPCDAGIVSLKHDEQWLVAGDEQGTLLIWDFRPLTLFNKSNHIINSLNNVNTVGQASPISISSHIEVHSRVS
eukprot:TRINITY_DN2593_c0_g1_i1.p1 TRINITY_DN2593_c0_g1~~TRINITY_DN2593_c0_g1_i1.p1  ORF type:complete len:593 (+),score=62.41 TRINITY_DN2593_c0_g1_i1:71-1849(+)